MKRFASVVLVLLLSLCLWGCREDAPFRENTGILGMDVSGLTREEAWAVVSGAAQEYVLELTVEDLTIPITAGDIGLTCSKDAFFVGIQNMKRDGMAFFDAINYDEAKLKAILEEQFSAPAENAYLVYDASAGSFRIQPHTDGIQLDTQDIAKELRNTIRALAPKYTVTEGMHILPARLREDSPKLVAALVQANKLVGTEIIYRFYDGPEAHEHRVTQEKLYSFVALDEDGLTVTIDREKVASYAAELAEEHKTQLSVGNFRTTTGVDANIAARYEALAVDADALAKDMIRSMEGGIAGVREAPCVDGVVPGRPYGGNYVEIDLTSQKIWLYKDGICLVDADLVSGNVRTGCNTPTGVYSIAYKDQNVVLRGRNYRSFVNYWLEFNDAYGLHDASWRSEFGGDIYLTDGSHGCVNLPFEVAQTIFNEAALDTKVVLYGGEGAKPFWNQVLNGKTAHTVTTDTKPFRLNIWTKFAKLTRIYTSDNPQVATVDQNGVVTVHSPGTANIHVAVASYKHYSGAELDVAITVQPAS